MKPRVIANTSVAIIHQASLSVYLQSSFFQISVRMAMKRKLEETNKVDKYTCSYGSQTSLSDLRAELAGAAKGSEASITGTVDPQTTRETCG